MLRSKLTKALTVAPYVTWSPYGQFQCSAEGADPALFDSTQPVDTAAALEVCGRCPLRWECLLRGITLAGTGVWGGQVLIDGTVLTDAPNWESIDIVPLPELAVAS